MTSQLVARTILLTPTLRDAIDAEAHARNMTAAGLLRWAATLGLRQLAEQRPDGGTCTTSAEASTTESPAQRRDPRLAEVWDHLADRRLVARGGRVTNPTAWRRKVIANARRELGARAVELCATYPDLRARDMAAVLDGATDLLRYERRV